MRCIIHHWGPVLSPFVSCQAKVCITAPNGAPPLRAPPKARVKKSHRDKKAADRTFGEAEWVSQGDWDFICWTRKTWCFFAGILGCRFLCVVLFFCNLALDFCYGFFCQTKMGLALLNMDFTEQMGICGVLDLEGDLLGRARFILKEEI